MNAFLQESLFMRCTSARIAILAILACLGGSGVLGQSVEVPPLSKIRRVEKGNFPTQKEQATSTFITRISPHPAIGEGYVIVTDLVDQESLDALGRLAKFHSGVILRFDDLGRLAVSVEARQDLETKLKGAKPKFVAVAPKPASYREEVVLALWDVFASLDSDPELDVFPGFLVAGDSKGLAGLVDRSIGYRSLARGAVRPFVVGQVVDNDSPQGTRSFQKVKILRNYFEEKKIEPSSLVVRMYRARKPGTVGTPSSREWDVSANAPGAEVEQIPSGARKALERSNVVAMFGHGAPGKTCSLDVDAFRNVDLSNKVILCGSCFSAAPLKSEFGRMDRDLDGSALKFDRTRFLDRALDRGAVVFFGHMRLNSGFPHLFPVLEGWMDGLTVGEGYQRLIDALLANNNFTPEEIPLPLGSNLDEKAINRRNILLYIVVGDPALRPIVPVSTPR
jgi:hypothetical protein